MAPIELPTTAQSGMAGGLAAIGSGLLGAVVLGGPLGLAAFGAGLLIGAGAGLCLKSMSEVEDDDSSNDPDGGEPPDGGVSGGVTDIVRRAPPVRPVTFAPAPRDDASIPPALYEALDVVMGSAAEVITVGRSFNESLIRRRWAVYVDDADGLKAQNDFIEGTLGHYRDGFQRIGDKFLLLRDEYLNAGFDDPMVKPDDIERWRTDINMTGFKDPALAAWFQQASFTEREASRMIYVLNSGATHPVAGPESITQNMTRVGAAAQSIAQDFVNEITLTKVRTLEKRRTSASRPRRR